MDRRHRGPFVVESDTSVDEASKVEGEGCAGRIGDAVGVHGEQNENRRRHKLLGSESGWTLIFYIDENVRNRGNNGEGEEISIFRKG